MFFIEVYNVVLVLGMQRSDSDIYVCVIFFFRFFSLAGYYKILSIILCAITLWVIYIIDGS